MCGSTDVANEGVIPSSEYFAGRVLNEPLSGGRLWLCFGCGSMFRHPILPWPAYFQLYESGAPTQWPGGERRRDLQIVRAIITAETAFRNVLDIGCGTGDFLSTLPSGYSKSGIEPSSAAAALACARGISVKGGDITELPPQLKFDIITIIDVIEHLPDPETLLQDAYTHLSPGGLIVISTGDPENATWRRWFKSRFWYSSFPEHLSFPSFKFIQIWARKNNVQTVAKQTIRYQTISWWQSALGIVMQIAYFFTPSAFNWVGRGVGVLRGLPRPRRRSFSPAVPGLFADHQVLTIRSPNGNDHYVI
jgi:SAM-dependent methyltransferase